MFRTLLISFTLFSIVFFSVFCGVTVEASPKKDIKVEKEAPKEPGMGKAILGIAAAVVFGLAAFATALVQSKIGTAGIGALAENPKLIGSVILLVAIPETILVFGFVVAFLLLGKI